MEKERRKFIWRYTSTKLRLTAESVRTSAGTPPPELDAPAPAF